MKNNYVKPQQMVKVSSITLCSDSDRARIAEERYELFHGRRDNGYSGTDNNGSGGCLGAIIMFIVVTFGIGSGIFYFV